MTERVVIIDTPAPLGHVSVLSSDPDRAHAEWLLRMADVRARYHGTAPPFDLDDLLQRDQTERMTFAAERLRAGRMLPLDADADWLARAHHTGMILYEAFLNYAPDPAMARDLPVGLIRASHQASGDLDEMETRWRDDPTMGWSQFIDGPIDVVTIEGDHVSILAGEQAGTVAQTIKAMLVGVPAAAQ